jgi:GR25 family glycosyltransferase involved in LPS biosynthesis
MILIIVILYVYRSPYFYNFKFVEVDLKRIHHIYNSTLQKPIHLYYININDCNKSKARKQRLLQRVQRFHYIVPVCIEAVTPKTLPKLILSSRCKKETDTINACTSSHLKAIHTAYHNNEQIAIIAEDDIIILKDIDWYYLSSLAPDDWDILQLHTIGVLGSTKSFNRIYQYKHSNSLWIKTNSNISSAAFYIVNRKGMKKILETYVIGYTHPNWDDTIEVDLTKQKSGCAADQIIYDNINRYICTHPFINVESIDSLLHDKHLNKYHKATTDYINNNL